MVSNPSRHTSTCWLFDLVEVACRFALLVNRNIFDNAVFVYKHKQFDRTVFCAATHRVVAISDNFIAVFATKQDST